MQSGDGAREETHGEEHRRDVERLNPGLGRGEGAKKKPPSGDRRGGSKEGGSGLREEELLLLGVAGAAALFFGFAGVAGGAFRLAGLAAGAGGEGEGGGGEGEGKETGHEVSEVDERVKESRKERGARARGPGSGESLVGTAAHVNHGRRGGLVFGGAGGETGGEDDGGEEEEGCFHFEGSVFVRVRDWMAQLNGRPKPPDNREFLDRNFGIANNLMPFGERIASTAKTKGVMGRVRGVAGMRELRYVGPHLAERAGLAKGVEGGRRWR